MTEDSPRPKAFYWTVIAATSWLIIGLATALVLTLWGCQATTRIDGAKANASSVTHTTRIKIDSPPPPPTIRVKIGPRPEPRP